MRQGEKGLKNEALVISAKKESFFRDLTKTNIFLFVMRTNPTGSIKTGMSTMEVNKGDFYVTLTSTFRTVKDISLSDRVLEQQIPHLFYLFHHGIVVFQSVKKSSLHQTQSLLD